MSRFLPLVKKSYEFQEDKIFAKFKHLTRSQMMAVTPYLPKATGEFVGKGKDKKPVMREQSDEDNMRLLDEALGFLKDNMVSFTGLKDAEGVEMKFEDVVDEAYFTPLLSGMAMDLIGESMVPGKK